MPENNSSDILRDSRSLVMNAPVGIFISTPEGRFLFVNPAQAKMHGYASPETFTAAVADIGRQLFASPDAWEEFINTLKTREEVLNFECQMTRKDGSVFWASIRARIVQDNSGETAYLQGFTTDITARKQAEEMIRQLRKTEHLEQFAGDIAHDYNNMLSVIHGYTESALQKISPDDPLRKDLEEVQDAARRATIVTRQLLAFGSKQAINPQVIDLNETVEDIINIIQRLIGENIELSWVPGENLWQAWMDPAQIDQILANLCTNARDAISGAGKVTIETENVSIDEVYCSYNTEASPGDYVMLAVTDNGHGMDRETQRTIFQPFFTTKAADRKTGLGLPTVYGIVRQNNGFIYVYSEPGQGTTFKIYLPRYTGPAGRTGEKVTTIARGNGETVLVVEDEIAVLTLAGKMLTGLNYRVLTANSPAEAIAMAETHAGAIRLLLTDVVMPGMNGMEVAGRVRAFCPDIRVLYMSGYTANTIVHRDFSENREHFIQKPFSRNHLGAKIREILSEGE